MKLEEICEKLKTAQAVGDNENEMIPGEEDVYRPMPEQKVPKDPFHNSSGVWANFKDGRDNTIDRIMSQFAGSAKADQELIRQNFTSETGKPGAYTAHSPLLNHKVDQPKETLMERVVRLTGRK